MGYQIEFALRQSAGRVLDTLAAFLPGILALLLAFIIFALLGAAAAWLVRRVLSAARFDERLAARQTSGGLFSVAEWSPANSPTQLFASLAWWICILAGLAVGISALNASYSTSSVVSMFLLPYITHIVGAALILLAGALLSRFLSRSILIGAVNAQLQYARFLSLGVKWLVLTLAGAMALDHLRIGGAIVELAFGILFGGIVLTLALAIGLGSRELVSRSIEKTLDRPVRVPGTPVPTRSVEQPTGTLRHF